MLALKNNNLHALDSHGQCIVGLIEHVSCTFSYGKEFEDCRGDEKMRAFLRIYIYLCFVSSNRAYEAR